jgi:hypothetical protein
MPDIVREPYPSTDDGDDKNCFWSPLTDEAEDGDDKQLDVYDTEEAVNRNE